MQKVGKLSLVPREKEFLARAKGNLRGDRKDSGKKNGEGEKDMDMERRSDGRRGRNFTKERNGAKTPERTGRRKC